MIVYSQHNKPEDKVISILRNFNWNQQKLETEWFDNMDELEIKCGIKYNKDLIKKWKDIDSTLAQNNDNTC